MIQVIRSAFKHAFDADLAAHDFALAQEAKDKLRRLGVTVEFRGLKAIARVSPPYSAGEGGL